MTNRFLELDSLRGLATILVCLYHYTDRYDEIYGHSIDNLPMFNDGDTGVYLFFIISGFVFLLSLKNIQYPLDFLISRLTRLYPAYWCAVIFTMTIYTFFILPDREVGIWTALVNLTMMQRFVSMDHVDGVYWTLTVELLFYGLMLLVLWFNQLKHLTHICIIWFCWICSVALCSKTLGYDLGTDLDLLFLTFHGNLFIAGLMFYKFWNEKKWGYLLFALATLVPELLYREKTFLMVCVYYVTFTMVSLRWLSWIAIKPLMFIGAISYPLYLIHQNLGYVIILKLYEYNWASVWTVVFVPLGVAILLASLIHYWVEKPALNYLRETWKDSQCRKNLKKRVSV